MTRRRRAARTHSVDASSMAVTIKYVRGENEEMKRSAINYLVHNLFPLLCLSSWKVQFMDDDFDSINRRSVFMTDNRGFTIHSTFGQEVLRSAKGEKPDDSKKNPPGDVLSKTVIYLWDRDDILNWGKYIAQIHKYTTTGCKKKDKNVVVLLFSKIDQSDLDSVFSSSMPKVRFAMFTRDDPSFVDKLHALITNPNGRKARKAWRYEHAIRSKEIPTENVRRRVSQATEQGVTAAEVPTEMHEFTSTLTQLCGDIKDTCAGVNENQAMLHTILAHLEELEGPLPQEDGPIQGEAEAMLNGNPVHQRLRQLFMKIQGRIRVRTRLFLRTLISDDTVIEEVGRRYRQTRHGEVSEEAIFKCLCCWAVMSTRMGKTADQLKMEIDAALELTQGNISAEEEMSARLKYVLNKNRTYIIDQLSDPEGVCMYLQGTGDLVEAHKYHVMQRLIPQSQKDYLIDILLTRCDSAYYNLVTLLLAEEGQRHIAEQLTETEMELGAQDPPNSEDEHRMDYIDELPTMEVPPDQPDSQSRKRSRTPSVDSGQGGAFQRAVAGRSNSFFARASLIASDFRRMFSKNKTNEE